MLLISYKILLIIYFDMQKVAFDLYTFTLPV